MAQHDYNLINQSGASFRADLNNALAAIATNNSGTAQPSTAFSYEWWIDTASSVLKIRNAANSAWITTGISLSQSNTFTGNATTATTLQTARTINGVSFNGSANITFNTDSVAEGSSNLYFTNERVDDRVDNLLVAGSGISLTYNDASNTLTIANTNDADITGVIAGNGLTGGGTSGNVTLNIDVDDSSIEIGSGGLRVKNSGITNTMLAGSITNAKLSNSSVTINSQSLSLGGSLDLDTSEIPENTNLYYTSARANTDFDTRLATKDTSNVAEGSNLYYTTARANADIDSRVTKSFVDGLSIAATTAATLLNSRDISLSGDVVGSVSFNGSGNVDIATTIQANSVALGTDTVGNYIQTITGTANKITVTGSGSETADVTLTLPDDVQIADSLTVAGNLTVNGTLVSLDSTNLDIQDNLFQLNAGLTGSPVNDTGMLINRGNQDNGIFMWDESVDKFTLGLTTADGSSTGNITLSSLGTLVANVEGNVTGDVTGQVSDISNFTTANLNENTNLYYTDARVQAVSINNVVEDTTPQLGGNLDLNSSDITGTGNINITGTIQSSGNITGTLATAAQPNITSLGTLTSFRSTGIDDNATSTAITIDSSENILVGKSVANTSTVGIEARENGLLVATRDGGQPLLIDRLTDDGDLVLFRKDSTTVGSIGTRDTGALEIGSGDVYLQFNGANDWIKPVDGSGNNKSGVDLGTSGAKFDNLYLSGTATMDGLTVEGDTLSMSHTGNTSTISLTQKAGTQNSVATISANREDTTTSASRLLFSTNDGTSTLQRIRINNGGDISFYEDTGTTAKFFWDASAESLGIGTTSQVRTLEVNSGTANAVARFESTDSRALIEFKDNAGTASIGNLGTNLTFFPDNVTQAMTLDASGNLLVGKSSATGHSTAGIEARGDGVLIATKAGIVQYLNRTGSDGTILNFAKDGTTVGSISNGGSQMGIGTGDVGWFFAANIDAILPTEADGTQRDGAIDLGASSHRLDDIYLAGSAFIDTQTRLGGGSAATPSYSFNADSDSGMFRATTNALGFSTAGVERLKIDSSGVISADGVYNTTSSDAANVRVLSNGNIVRSTSSRKYKNSITDASKGLTELNNLRPVTYKGNNDGETVFYGLIAEEVHDAGLTEFVEYNDDNEPDALRYPHMVSLCIKAIQEQQDLINNLTARIEQLEN